MTQAVTRLFGIARDITLSEVGEKTMTRVGQPSSAVESLTLPQDYFHFQESNSDCDRAAI